MTEIVHLGNESKRTYRQAEVLLRKGKTVSFVGLGWSMDPIIPHETRMVFEPYKGQEIVPGRPLFTTQHIWIRKGERRSKIRVYSCHMVWMMVDGHILIGSTGGHFDYWCAFENILGVYVGAHKEPV